MLEMVHGKGTPMSKQVRGGGIVNALMALVAIMVLSAFLVPVSAYAAEAQASNEESLHQAIAGASGPTTIELTGDIALTQPISMSGKDITLTDDGNPRKLTFAGVTGDVFTVAEGASLTLDGASLTVDGTDSSLPPGCAVFRVNGRLALKRGTITNATTSGVLYTGNPAGGVVAVQGPNASFDMTGGAITKNSETFSFGSAIVFVSGGAKFDLSGGEISKNDLTSSEGSYVDGEWKGPKKASFHAPVWVYPDGGSTMTMTGGAISGNTGSLAGAVMVGYPLNAASNGAAKFNFSGGEISNNIGAAYSGAVSLFSRGTAPAQFNMSGTAKITGNVGPAGGGVSTSDDYANTQPDKDKEPEKFQQWLDGYAAYQQNFKGEQFTMTGGDISNNRAVLLKDWNSGVGGGVYVASDTVKLSGGTIAHNTADLQGGGIYVGTDPYKLRLMDAVVTANTASVMGGGIWLCPTGDAQSAVRNGGAIFGNTAGETAQDENAAGNDIASVSKKFNVKLYLSNRMPGNWMTEWSNDGGIKDHSQVDSAYWIGEPDDQAKRYANMSVPEKAAANRGGIIDSTDDLALQAVASDKGKQAANAAAKLLITGNSAPRGGGIGTNGAVVFGEYPVEYPKVSVTVTKQWSDDENKDGKRPTSVIVGLYQDGQQIDERELNKDNGWKFTWNDLQKYAGDDPVEAAGKKLSTYTVKEVASDPSDGLSSYDATVTDDEDKGENFSYIITNTRKVAPVSFAVPVSKLVKGTDADADASFSFTLVAADDATKAAVAGGTLTGLGEGGALHATVAGPFEDGAAKSAAFGDLTATSVGTYTFSVTEDGSGSAPENWTYDKSVKTVTVTVTKGADGKLVAAVTSSDGEGGPVFTNSYEAPKTPPATPATPAEPPAESDEPNKELPQTGDATPSAVVFTGAAVVAAAVIAVGIALRKAGLR